MSTIRSAIYRQAFKSTYRLFRGLRNQRNGGARRKEIPSGTRLRVAFIHNEKKLGTGAHYINELMAQKLRLRGLAVKTFYPKTKLIDTAVELRGIANILFFHSLLEHKEQILKNHIIQGTTYTALPFLAFHVPIVSHFGSTTAGFLKAVPLAKNLPLETRRLWRLFHKEEIIPELDVKTRRPMHDIAAMEALVASRATAVIATSQIVHDELIELGVPPERVRIIHNAIEDYWFEMRPAQTTAPARIVFLGRLGNDPFTLKLKGFDRLVHVYRELADLPKTTICMTTNRKLKEWLKNSIPEHDIFVNLSKELIPNILAPLRGSILFLPSRYEGFSLSLIEGMSQGLVPVTYPIGVAPEIIHDGINGYIVRSQAEAIARIRELHTNAAMRERMAEAAKITAEQFKSERIAKELVSLYYSIRTARSAEASA